MKAEDRARRQQLLLERSHELLAKDKHHLYVRTDRLFAGLMVAQWLFGIACALIISPRTWSGTVSEVHPHVWAAIFLGGAFAVAPVVLCLAYPGARLTRHTIAGCQMLFSTLLIHLTGGRIETHFHIFGSLAFLAFYLDCQVLLTATAIVAFDHFLGKLYFPESVYGVAFVSPLRFLEHAGWIAFEDVFLIYSCISGNRQLQEVCLQRAKLEAEIKEKESMLVEREASRSAMLATAKLASIGETASTIGHEINNPLAIIEGRLRMLTQLYNDKPEDRAGIKSLIASLFATCERIRSIVNGLRAMSRDCDSDEMQVAAAQEVVKAALDIARDRLRSHGVDLRTRFPEAAAQVGAGDSITCHQVQIGQVIGNLVNNSFDAIQDLPEKWIEVAVVVDADTVEISVTDCGKGIPAAVVSKLMTPFFTTKAVGKGTGIGLTVSKRIVEAHGGQFFYDRESAHTRFVIRLPRVGVTQATAVA